MMRVFANPSAFSLLCISFAGLNLRGQELDSLLPAPTVALDEVILEARVLFGSKFQAKNRTGSAYYVSPQELAKFNYTDVNRALRSVPGVNLYEEDGFGLRPNISLRGTSPQRSSKITLMEDGVLIAPAPYSAPAAYYFPNIGRMQALEVLKGSSQVQFGPFTTGGAINLLSSPVPETFEGYLRSQYGSFGSSQLHARLGDRGQSLGYVFEFLQLNSNGFKILDNGGNTGFDQTDVMAKLHWNLGSSLSKLHSIELKFQYSDELSNETYLGLSAEDFETSPFGRYASSGKDKMEADHQQLMLTHTLELSDGLRVSTTAYRNEFKRNWYKLNDITLNGSRVGLSKILDAPELYPEYYEVMKGNADSPADALALKANNRAYLAEGIQTKLDWHRRSANGNFHDLELGFRLHYDKEDRFQWIDGYAMENSQLVRTSEGVPGTDANRISDANALASFAMYRLKAGNFTLTPGLRYENIRLERRDFGLNESNNRGTVTGNKTNDVQVWIPGVGFNYNFELVSLFGGIHRGFSPPGNQEGQLPEKSMNYELGSRFVRGRFSGELVGFYNNFSNLLGNDFAATGGTGSLDQFNAGAVRVSGLEFLVNYELLAPNQKIKMPFTFGYTFTRSIFQSSFGSEDGLWGEVQQGDALPYLSPHQWNATLGFNKKSIEFNLNARYASAFRTIAGKGAIPESSRIDANLVLDFNAKYALNKQLKLTCNVVNLLNETYAVSRVPAGLRPGHPFGIFGGITLNY
jgi:Fe(3+) dicitrate transport protein